MTSLCGGGDFPIESLCGSAHIAGTEANELLQQQGETQMLGETQVLQLVFLGMLAALFALVFNLQTVLALSERAIDRVVQGRVKRSVARWRLGRVHK
jgi:hypothetical protein